MLFCTFEIFPNLKLRIGGEKYKERNAKELLREAISYAKPKEEARKKVGKGEEDKWAEVEFGVREWG